MRLNIFYKFLLVTLVASLVPLSALWWANRTVSHVAWSDAANQRLEETANSLAGKIDDWARTNLLLLEQLAKLEAIKSMDPERQNPVLKSVSKTYNWTYLVFTIAPDGRNIGRNDGRKTMYFGDRVYFLDVLHGKPHGQQVLIGRTSGKPTYVLSVPIRGTENQLLGVVALSAQLDAITAAVGGRRIGNTGFAFLLDDKGKVIAHRDTEKAQSLLDLHDHQAVVEAEGGKNSSVTFVENGERQVAEVRRVGLGWTLVVQQSYEEAFATLYEADRLASYLFIAALLLSLVIAGFTAKRLSLPLRSLTDASNEISRGRLGIKVPETHRSDEIGELAKGIERMAVSVRLLGDRLFKAREEQKLAMARTSKETP